MWLPPIRRYLLKYACYIISSLFRRPSNEITMQFLKWLTFWGLFSESAESFFLLSDRGMMLRTDMEQWELFWLMLGASPPLPLPPPASPTPLPPPPRDFFSTMASIHETEPANCRKIDEKRYTCMLSVLQRHNTKNSKQIFTEKENCMASVPIVHASVSYLYIPSIGLPILL